MLMDVEQFKKIEVFFFKWLNFSLPVWKGAPNLFERSEQIERALIGGWTGSFDNQIGIRFFGYNTLLILYLCFDDNYIILYYIGNFNWN